MHYKAPSLDDYTAMQVGKQVAELFNLKADKDGRYNTSFGTKTLVGLGRCVERVMHDATVTCEELLEKTDKQAAIEDRNVVSFPPIFYGDDE